jgi:hypothetical protein
VTAERAANWAVIICAVVAGAMRFGSVESDVKHLRDDLTGTQQHISNVDGRVETLKADKVSADKEMSERIHALTTSIAVLTAEVRELRVQLENTERKR